MYLETKDLHLLNGSFFRVDFNSIPHDDLKSILRLCGLKSSQSSSTKQQILVLEKIRRYLLTGDLVELNSDNITKVNHNENRGSSKNTADKKKKGIKKPLISYGDIINENTITTELVINSIINDKILLENIMLNGKTTVFEVLESCSRYLNVPRNIISCQSIKEKIRSVLISLDINLLKE